MRRLAIERGWSLNEYGLTHGERGRGRAHEEDVSRRSAWRGSAGSARCARDRAGRERAAAEAHRTVRPARDLHMHTTRSEARLDRAMVEAALATG